MPREGRPFWWPRCIRCGRWLDWERIALLSCLDDPWRCARCARAVNPLPEETAHV